MATMLVQHKVKNFANWKKVYDSVAGLWQSKCEASDPNKLTLVFNGLYWQMLKNGPNLPS
jgi:hypothetical protein